MKPSLPLLPLLLVIIFLSGCPDSKIPKVPPKVPEPKAVAADAMGAGRLDAPLTTRVR
jgi:hypothetical protein